MISQWPWQEIPLQWRHNGCNGVSNHQPHNCLLNRLSRRRSEKTPKHRVTGLCAGNSPVTGEFPAQRASSGETVSIQCRHHVQYCPIITPRARPWSQICAFHFEFKIWSMFYVNHCSTVWNILWRCDMDIFFPLLAFYAGRINGHRTVSAVDIHQPSNCMWVAVIGIYHTVYVTITRLSWIVYWCISPGHTLESLWYVLVIKSYFAVPFRVCNITFPLPPSRIHPSRRHRKHSNLIPAFRVKSPYYRFCFLLASCGSNK